MKDTALLSEVVQSLMAPGKGILAADESFPTIEKRFAKLGIVSTRETRRAYRELLFTTHGIEEFISGIILFDETTRQSTKDGKPFVKILEERGVVPGIKVDQGTKPFFPNSEEKITKGLSGLEARLEEYKSLGAKFTKWRGVITIGSGIPTEACIEKNMDLMAQYALVSQEAGLVPIVEPETLMDGDHTIEVCEETTKKVLVELFERLNQQKVFLAGTLLKVNMVLPGKESGKSASSEEVAERTLKVLKGTVPENLGGVVFLSGGQSPEAATERLNEMNKIGGAAWPIGFSYSRALQGPAMEAWGGKEENVALAQKDFYKRARLNSLARKAEYSKEMENE